MDFHEALLVWAQERRRRDCGEPFDRQRVVAALRSLFATVAESGEPIDLGVAPSLALSLSGTYDVGTATDDEMLRLAEDMYRAIGPGPND